MTATTITAVIAARARDHPTMALLDIIRHFTFCVTCAVPFLPFADTATSNVHCVA